MEKDVDGRGRNKRGGYWVDTLLEEESLTVREESEREPDDGLSNEPDDGFSNESDDGLSNEPDDGFSNESDDEFLDEPDNDEDGYYLDEDYENSAFPDEFDDFEEEYEGEEDYEREEDYESEEESGEDVFVNELEKEETILKKSSNDKEERVEKELNSEEQKGKGITIESEKEKADSKKGSSGKKALAACLTLVGVGLAAGIGAYVIKAGDYRETFCPNTVINGLNAEGMSVEDVKANMSSSLNNYQIRLIGRDGKETVVSRDDIGLHTVFDGTLERMMKDQNPYLWGLAYFGGESSNVDAVIAYDDQTFAAYIDRLSYFDPAQEIPYREAYLSEYIEGKGYEIVPEEPGTAMDKEKFSQAFSQAVLAMQTQLVLEDTGCYMRYRQEPSASLTELRDRMNRYATMTVTYTFGETEEVLNGDEIHQWISFDEKDQVQVDEAMVEDYVAKLAKKYNTAYTERKFKTTYGQEVEVSGAYGWRINEEEEIKALTEAILSGESRSREPEYLQTGASHGENDYGDTYAEVNLTAQHLFLYVDGKKVMESDFVSGNVARGFTTPPGLFSIAYKQKDAVLRGPGYASPVRFWMPFNGGIGFHDANWRGQFGGSIYRTSGSHGCVNMPYQEAKTLFENVYTGMPVICYNLDGTGNQTSTAAYGGAAITAPVQETAPVPLPLPAEAVPAVTPEEAAALLPSEEQPAVQETEAATEPSSQPSGNQWREYGPGWQQAQPGPAETSAPAPAEAPAPGPGSGETPAPAPGEAPAPGPAETPAPAPAAPAEAPNVPAPAEIPETAPLVG